MRWISANPDQAIFGVKLHEHKCSPRSPEAVAQPVRPATVVLPSRISLKLKVVAAVAEFRHRVHQAHRVRMDSPVVTDSLVLLEMTVLKDHPQLPLLKSTFASTAQMVLPDLPAALDPKAHPVKRVNLEMPPMVVNEAHLVHPDPAVLPDSLEIRVNPVNLDPLARLSKSLDNPDLLDLLDPLDHPDQKAHLAHLEIPVPMANLAVPEMAARTAILEILDPMETREPTENLGRVADAIIVLRLAQLPDIKDHAVIIIGFLLYHPFVLSKRS